MSIFVFFRDKYVDSKLDNLSEKEKFTMIYKTGYWRSNVNNSLSGAGSDLEATKRIRLDLSLFIRENNINTMLDLPCGDWKWMSKIDLSDVNYIGGDIVDRIINKNNLLFSNDNCKFKVMDIVADDLPRVDLIFVRDCLVHLTDKQIICAIENIVQSGSTYFATTIFPRCSINSESKASDRWRQLNLTIKPFSFPEPIKLLDDRDLSNKSDSDKYIGIWKISDLNI